MSELEFSDGGLRLESVEGRVEDDVGVASANRELPSPRRLELAAPLAFR
jgi:hypothetical protein